VSINQWKHQKQTSKKDQEIGKAEACYSGSKEMSGSEATEGIFSGSPACSKASMKPSRSSPGIRVPMNDKAGALLGHHMSDGCEKLHRKT
jgi:hypothetical protein